MRTTGGVHTIGVQLIGGLPPPTNQGTTAQERPGRIEYLFLTPKQKIAARDMDEAIDGLPHLTRLRCRTPLTRKVNGKEVAFFPHMDYDERTPPTATQADLMCKTAGKMCPVAEQCLKLGLTLPETSGVWGGKTLLDGKIYNQKEETHDRSQG